ECPEPDARRVVDAKREDPGFPDCVFNLSDFVTKLFSCELVRRIQVSDLNEDLGHSRCSSVYQLEAAHRSEEWSPGAVLVAPADTVLESQSAQQSRELLESLGRCTTHQGEAADHQLQCDTTPEEGKNSHPGSRRNIIRPSRGADPSSFPGGVNQVPIFR